MKRMGKEVMLAPGTNNQQLKITNIQYSILHIKY